MRKLLTALTVACVIAALGVTGALAAGADVHAAKTRTVKINDDFYSVGKVTIKQGGTVKWVWNGTTNDDHSVVANNGKFASKEKDHGTFKHKFGNAGTFKIHCSVHPDEMRMKVVVMKP